MDAIREAMIHTCPHCEARIPPCDQRRADGDNHYCIHCKRAYLFGEVVGVKPWAIDLVRETVHAR